MLVNELTNYISRVVLETLTFVQLVNIILVIYGTQSSSIIVFTIVHHLALT
jgi:hypothetical protein